MSDYINERCQKDEKEGRKFVDIDTTASISQDADAFAYGGNGGAGGAGGAGGGNGGNGGNGGAGGDIDIDQDADIDIDNDVDQ